MTSSLSSHGEQKLTPQPLLDMNYAFARTALLVAAVRLHLFTHLSKKALTPAELPLVKQEDTALHVLDVGAGSAPWSAAFAHSYPSARITALDLPAVVEQGRQQIANLGLSDRYTWIGADMETVAFPPLTYDLIICGHVCRFISDERTKTLLARLCASLRSGGTIIIADVFLSEDRNGPPPAITLNLSMLVNTAQGRIRTVSEIATWLIESGLQDVQQFRAVGPFPVVVARKGEER